MKSAQQIEQQPVSLANQCRDVLVEWLREKAAEEAFAPDSKAELVTEACTHLNSNVLEPKTNSYGIPAKFHQAITLRLNLWAQFQALRMETAPNL